METNPEPNFGICTTDSVSSESRASVAGDNAACTFTIRFDLLELNSLFVRVR
jgi:hypothetical protein